MRDGGKPVDQCALGQVHPAAPEDPELPVQRRVIGTQRQRQQQGSLPGGMALRGLVAPVVNADRRVEGDGVGIRAGRGEGRQVGEQETSPPTRFSSQDANAQNWT